MQIGSFGKSGERIGGAGTAVVFLAWADGPVAAATARRLAGRYEFVKDVWFFGTETTKSYRDSRWSLHPGPVRV
jgi:hypothetical protein